MLWEETGQGNNSRFERVKEPTFIKSAMYVFQAFSELNLKNLGTSLARHLRTFLTWDSGAEKTYPLQ